MAAAQVPCRLAALPQSRRRSVEARSAHRLQQLGPQLPAAWEVAVSACNLGWCLARFPGKQGMLDKRRRAEVSSLV